MGGSFGATAAVLATEPVKDLAHRRSRSSNKVSNFDRRGKCRGTGACRVMSDRTLFGDAGGSQSCVLTGLQ